MSVLRATAPQLRPGSDHYELVLIALIQGGGSVSGRLGGDGDIDAVGGSGDDEDVLIDPYGLRGDRDVVG